MYRSMLWHVWAVIAYAALVSQSIQAQKCGNLIKSITFEGHAEGSKKVPYTEDLAYKDWAPYSYLDGFHGDMKTRGSNQERAWLAPARDSAKGLEVVLPKGCVTGACAMQVKSVLPVPVESATLKFKMKFGPNFDWVRGGKLPGLCGAECQTGCKEVTGLDGFSSRHMWRPCVWPPEHEDNEINCTGGKLVAYVYHMLKEHWCGDDFEFSNRAWARNYRTNREPVVPKNFFQPEPDEWYTVWSHVQMNTAGPPGSSRKNKRDGKLQTWLQGPGFDPLLVVDKQNMGWRVFNNVTIDTLYFSVFFGGSSPSFQAKKDETILFDDFQVWEGRCAPAAEPFDQKLAQPVPEWAGMKRITARSNLKVQTIFTKASTGGGCAKFHVENNSPLECDVYHVHLHVRPSWGKLSEREGEYILHGATVIDTDDAAGYYRLQSDPGTIGGKETIKRAGMCVTNFQGAKYLKEDLSSHVRATAVCVAGPAATDSRSHVESTTGTEGETPRDVEEEAAHDVEGKITPKDDEPVGASPVDTRDDGRDRRDRERGERAPRSYTIRSLDVQGSDDSATGDSMARSTMLPPDNQGEACGWSGFKVEPTPANKARAVDVLGELEWPWVVLTMVWLAIGAAQLAFLYCCIVLRPAPVRN